MAIWNDMRRAAVRWEELEVDASDKSVEVYSYGRVVPKYKLIKLSISMADDLWDMFSSTFVIRGLEDKAKL